MALTLNPITLGYKVAKGVIQFNRLRDDGTYEGFRDCKNCPTFSISIESANLTHTSSRGGVGEIDLDAPISITRTAAFGCDSLDDDNAAAFLGATALVIDQASATVTNEAINRITAGRSYQLGEATITGGVRDISAVAVDVNATARANSTAYAVGDIYAPATPNDHIYICTVAGTSAGSPPTFNTAGSTHTDGTATFLDLGVVTSLVSGTDFYVDLATAFLGIPTTGKIGTAFAAAELAVGYENFELNLHVDYTRPARKRRQIATGALAALRGQLRFLADNPFGANQDVWIPDATLRPDGEFAFITADEVAAVNFTVGINKLNSTTAAIYIDGRAYS